MKAIEVLSYATNAAREIRPQHLRALSRVARLRLSPTAEQLDHAKTAFASARTNGTPVVIPAKNEQVDIGTTLLALAANPNALPLVIDNGSTDDTAGVAERMGAVVVAQPAGRKMAATQAGVAYALDELGARKVLFTDADTRVVKTWRDGMSHALESHGGENGAAVYGNVLMGFGSSRLADLAASGLNLTYAQMKKARSEPPITRGANYALQFDPAGTVRGVIDGMNPDLFMGRDPSQHEDYQVGLALAGAGVPIVSLTNPETWVLSRNDRIHSLRQVLAGATGKIDPVETTLDSYQAQYEL